MVRKSLGHYTNLRQIGSGGMGEVYAADDPKLNRQVALKLLPEEMASQPERVARFEREAKAVAALDHPNIVTIHSVEQAVGVHFITMQLVEGTTLSQRIPKKGFTLEEFFDLAIPIADAISAAHDHGITHRDLKPANIMVSNGGKVKILDFGLAKLREEVAADGPTVLPEVPLTEEGKIVGTVAYMSPEQAEGRPVDHRSDIFSLGIILYEMATGERPFKGDTRISVISSIVKDTPTSVTELNASLPRHLGRIVRRCLAKDRRQRYQTTTDVCNELEDLQKEESSGESRLQPVQRVAVHRFPVVGSIAFAMIALLVAALWGWLREPPEPPRPIEYRKIAFTNPDRSRTYWGSSINMSPDGSRIAYVSTEGATAGGEGARWLHLPDRLDAVPLSDLGVGQHMTFSPDGLSAAFRQGGWLGAIWVTRVPGGQRTRITDSAGGGGLDWGTDGWIYFTNTHRGISRVPAEEGLEQILTTVDSSKGEYVHLFPELLPERRGLLFVVRYRGLADLDQSQIEVLDLESRERRVLERGIQAQYAASGHLVFARKDGTLLAVRFDLETLTTIGPPVEMLRGVSVIGGYSGRAEFELSDNGTLLYATEGSYEEERLFWVNRDGEPEALAPGWGGTMTHPTVSRDGSHVAVSMWRDKNPRNIWIRELPDGEPRRLTFGGVLDLYPEFTPDGEVIFSSPREGDNWDLFSRPSDGRGQVELVRDLPGEIRQPEASSDGLWILWEERVVGNTDIQALSRGDEQPIAIDPTQYIEAYPQLSPNDRWLAYQSNRTGRNEVYVVSFPDPSEPIPITYDGGRHPNWSPDGEWLFYENPEGMIVAVEVTTDESTFDRGGREELFSLAENGWKSDYDISWDDGRFLMVKQGPTEATGEVIQVRNWFEKLKRQLPIR